jgi:hypothetical protein
MEGVRSPRTRKGSEPKKKDGVRPLQTGPRRCSVIGRLRSTETTAFSSSDTYMAYGGRYRRRRFAAFAVSSEDVVRKAHQPHYQSRDYDLLNGGWTELTMSSLPGLRKRIFQTALEMRLTHHVHCLARTADAQSPLVIGFPLSMKMIAIATLKRE